MKLIFTKLVDLISLLQSHYAYSNEITFLAKDGEVPCRPPLVALKQWSENK